MSFYKQFKIQPSAALYVWEITESLSELLATSTLTSKSLQRLNSMKSESHQKGFLAVRQLLQHLNYTDHDLHYDANGKPHLKTNNSNTKPVEISISHSHNYSAIGISSTAIGIDLEMQREKILKIENKFSVYPIRQNVKQNHVRQLTIIWGIKEAIFKIENQEGISFKDHITEEFFDLNDQFGSAFLDFKSVKKTYKFHFFEFENYTLVAVFPNSSKLLV